MSSRINLLFILRKKTRSSDVWHFRYKVLDCVHVAAVAETIFLVIWRPVLPANLVANIRAQVEVSSRVVNVWIVQANESDTLKCKLIEDDICIKTS
jgi:hypothetical protein